MSTTILARCPSNFQLQGFRSDDIDDKNVDNRSVGGQSQRVDEREVPSVTYHASEAERRKQFLEDYEHLLPFPKGEIHGVYKKIAETPHALIERGRDQYGVFRHQIFFGIGSSWSALHKYAQDKDLRGHDGLELSMVLSAHAAVDYLTVICHEQLSLEPVISADHSVVVSLYSNYMQWDKELYEDEENEVLDKIRHELGTPKEVAMWFHPA